MGWGNDEKTSLSNVHPKIDSLTQCYNANTAIIIIISG